MTAKQIKILIDKYETLEKSSSNSKTPADFEKLVTAFYQAEGDLLTALAKNTDTAICYKGKVYAVDQEECLLVVPRILDLDTELQKPLHWRYGSHYVYKPGVKVWSTGNRQADAVVKGRIWHILIPDGSLTIKTRGKARNVKEAKLECERRLRLLEKAFEVHGEQ
ncbi:MAG: hypothetical protein WC824_11505 [Bacteroidota bacterium]|jgi:hypothetical protein